MNTNNRQINTDFNKSSSQEITLTVKEDIVMDGKQYRVGEKMAVPKSDAKGILRKHKKSFNISLD